MRETDAILQAILYQVEVSETKDDIKTFVKSMCNKQNLDAVAVLLQERSEKKMKEEVKP
jgi:hypothetical protein